MDIWVKKSIIPVLFLSAISATSAFADAYNLSTGEYYLQLQNGGAMNLDSGEIFVPIRGQMQPTYSQPNTIIIIQPADTAFPPAEVNYHFDTIQNLINR